MDKIEELSWMGEIENVLNATELYEMLFFQSHRHPLMSITKWFAMAITSKK